MDLLSAGLSIGGKILGGIFGNRKAKRQRQQAIEDERQRFVRVREGAELAGYNPLTALQYGGTGNSSFPSGSIAPLASVDLIAGAVGDLAQEFSSETRQQRARDQLELDLARIKLQQLSAAAAVGPGPTLGNNAVPRSMASYSSASLSPKTSVRPPRNPNPIAPDREVETDPLTNSPGVFEIDNALTKGPITIPGDGEPWGIDELATAAVVGLPQVGYNWAKDKGLADTKEDRKAQEDAGITQQRYIPGIGYNPWFGIRTNIGVKN